MKFTNLEIRNLVSHKYTKVDLSSLGSLVAITGSNGSGKTSFLESFLALFTGEFPSRGSLASSLSKSNKEDKDVGSIKADVEYQGKSYEVFVSSKPEGYIKLGQEIIAGKKISHFYNKVENLFGSSQIMLASIFSSQSGLGDLCDIKPSERRQFFAKLLDFSHLQTISDTAKAKVRVFKDELLALEAVMHSRSETIAQEEACKVQLLEANDRWRDLVENKKQLEEQQKLYEVQLSRLNEYDQQLKTYSVMQKVYEEYQKELQEVPALKEAVSKEPLLSLQSDKLLELKNRLEQIKQEQSALNTLIKSKSDLENQLSAYEESYLKDLVETEPLRKLVLTLPELEKEKASLAVHKSTIEELKRTIQSLEASSRLLEQKQYQLLQKQQKLEEIKKQYSQVSTVPCELKYKTCQFLTDALNSEQARPELEASIVVLDSEVQSLAFSISVKPELDKEFAEEQQRYTSRSNEVLVKSTQAEAAKKRVEAFDKQYHENNDYLNKVSKLKAELSVVSQELSGKEQLLSQVAPLEAEYLDKSDKFNKNQLKVQSAKEKLEAFSRKYATPPEQPVVPIKVEPGSPLVDKSNLISEVNDAIGEQQKLIGGCESLLATIAQAKDAVKEQLERKQTLTTSSQSYESIQEIFGPTGIQPYLIETLKSEIEKISNELLSAVYPNLKISISTQKELKSKEGTKEEINIYVYDGEYKNDIQSFSGGEKRIVKLCLRFALSVFTSVMSGRMYKTLFIDEAFDNLDLDNSLALLEVLRGLKKYFEQVFIVSHNAQLLSSLPTVLKFTKDGRQSSHEVIRNGG